jgi:NitT/TauT family transport system substrate-binding protein
VRVAAAILVLPLAAIWVAQRKGYYQAEGLEVELTLAPGLQGTQGLLAGNLDFMAGGATDLMVLAEKGEVLQAIATIEPVMLFHLLVKPNVLDRIGAQPNDPLEKRIASIKGLTLAVAAEGGAADTVLRMMLREARLQPTDIKKIVISSEASQLAALDQGQIDGLVGGPPRSDWLDRDRQALILLSAHEIPVMKDAIYEVVYSLKSWIDTHPDEARSMARAMARANRFLKEDPDAAQFLFETDFKNTPADVLKLSLDKMRAFIPADARMSPQQWLGVQRYAMEVGYLSRSIDMSEGVYWTNKFLS